MSEPTLDDLRVMDLDDEFNDEIVPRPLTPAEFDRIATERGYVKRPVCGECEGTGNGWETSRQPVCPSCDGTGFDEMCLTHGSGYYDEALCSAQMARLYHETGGNDPKGLAWVNEQYGECKWAAAIDGGQEGDTQ